MFGYGRGERIKTVGRVPSVLDINWNQEHFSFAWDKIRNHTCRDDLLEDPNEVEVREMETATLAALEAVDGPGWRVVRVGGGQRGLPSHDADFVVTHDTDPERWVSDQNRRS